MMNARVALLVILSVVTARAEEGEKAGGFVPPTQPSGDVYFFETFNDEETFDNKWVRSAAKKEGVAEDVSKYDGEWAIEAATGGSFPEDKGLVMKSASKHHAIAAKLDRQFSFEAKDMFVVQYEVNFQKGMGCGGAYMKLLSDNDSLKLDSFYDKTPYTIMFGPDKCGADSKLHFIFRHKNPLTGSFEEKHAKPSSKLTFFDDRKTHLFTLVVRSDNTYSIMVDQFSVNEGSLLEDFTPPVNPDKEIDDPEDSKPDDWDEREKIPDPDASKPDDWDEDAPAKIPDMDVEKPEGWLDDGPEFIPDPESSKPEDWDDEMDGDWEPPMIPNPACQEVGCGEWKRPLKNNPDYKGKWSAPMIENPNYKGIWKPRRIPNPNFFEDKHPFRMTPIIAVGFELWTVTEDVYFDNIIITSELTVANNFAYESWTKKFEKEEERDGGSAITEWLGFIVDAANENPLLWALYAIVPILPCVLFMWCCCRSSGPEPQAVEEVLRRKKTDEPLPDEPSDTEDTDSGSRTKKKKGKTDEEESFVEEDELPTTEKEDENAEAGGDGGEEEEEPQREEVTESPRKARRRGKKKAERED